MDRAQDATYLKKGVSIILCTFNGRDRLASTLEHLRVQCLNILCEIILVDNASTDGTKQFADEWWNTYGIGCSIRYKSYLEPKPGKSYAQSLGYSKAEYSYLLICDDDNWLSENYVQKAFDLMENHPAIGALGGFGEAFFENSKPIWFDQYKHLFAVGRQGSYSGDITNETGYLYGAGMVLRKDHWIELNSLGFDHILSCRKGDTLSSGGDTEYCYALRLLGYKIWYDETLYFKHFIPTGRLSLSYVSRLRQAMSYANFVIMAYHDVLVYREFNTNIMRKRVSRLVKLAIFKNSYRRLFGSFEQKEVAKNYFRKVYYMMFKNNEYQNNIDKITKWNPATSNSVKTSI